MSCVAGSDWQPCMLQGQLERLRLKEAAALPDPTKASSIHELWQRLADAESRVQELSDARPAVPSSRSTSGKLSIWLAWVSLKSCGPLAGLIAACMHCEPAGCRKSFITQSLLAAYCRQLQVTSLPAQQPYIDCHLPCIRAAGQLGAAWPQLEASKRQAAHTGSPGEPLQLQQQPTRIPAHPGRRTALSLDTGAQGGAASALLVPSTPSQQGASTVGSPLASPASQQRASTAGALLGAKASQQLGPAANPIQAAPPTSHAALAECSSASGGARRSVMSLLPQALRRALAQLAAYCCRCGLSSWVLLAWWLAFCRNPGAALMTLSQSIRQCGLNNHFL